MQHFGCPVFRWKKDSFAYLDGCHHLRFREFFDIVIGLARKNNVKMTDEELMAEANKWELSHGGISGRTAQQFINYCLGGRE